MAARQRQPAGQTAAPADAQPGRGSSTTLLPDGRSLIVGGDRTEARAWLWDPQARTTVAVAAGPQAPRAWHSATVLADGTVLVLGGRNGSALVETPEVFDPATSAFTPLPVVGAVSRAEQTATLLIDGRVLVAGGTNGGSVPLPTQIWDLAAHTATTVGAAGVARAGHTATLMADGRVLLTGGDALDGARGEAAMTVDPASGSVQRIDSPAQTQTVTAVAGSSPAPTSQDVSVDAHVAVQFSAPALGESLTPDTLSLAGPDGPVTTRVVAAEGGRLAFVWPATRLKESSQYTLTISGARDQQGGAVVPSSVTFTTAAQAADPADAADVEEWIPDAAAVSQGWRANRPPSSWESLPPLMAQPGVTAISGRVLTLDGRPLPGVTLEMDGAKTGSDRTGRFLLLLPSIGGRHVLDIHGDTANRPARKYGFFEYGMTVVPGQTNVLTFTIWMPKLDVRHVVRIPSPTRREVVITTPYIPGLELHLPPDTVIRGEDGKPVTELGITAIPVDRPPFPLPKNVEVPVYFTIQPGGAYVQTSGSGPKGASLVYPNYRGGVPGQRAQFFHYDPDGKDWYVYGPGRISADGRQGVPDATTRFYAFTGAMFQTGNQPPVKSPNDDPKKKADPIDPSTGLFLMTKTDLYLPDVMPLALTRTYNSGDSLNRSFGFGMVNPYNMFVWSAHQYTEADLVLPDGAMIHYVRTSPGTNFQDAVFTASTTPTAFYQSKIAWRPENDGWNLTLKDGTTYVFGNDAPLQAIRDRYGNQVSITHANGQSGNVTRVTSPNGRFIAFSYDGSNRITQAVDNIGRTVGYTYDANGNLSAVTDPESNVTTYTYDTSHRLLTIKDGRNIVYLTNVYTNGRVTQQALANPSATYLLSYTVDGSGNITQTDITDPRGHVERMVFNSGHYVTSETQAYGTALARTTTTTRQSGSNLVTAVVDGLSRRTEYTYDSSGHVLTTTRLSGTANAVTTAYTYEPQFFQVATVTDPLNHTWTIGYDASGRPKTITDPLAHQTTLGYNAAAQVTSVTDPLSHAWQFGYTDGDLTSTTSPLGAVASRFVDAAGRAITATDPLGRLTRTVYDRLDRVTSVTDGLGGQTAFTYDANSNLLSLTDTLSHTTSYTYDTSDRVASRTDPLTHAASYVYDLNGNRTQGTDRKSQVTAYNYDALDRLTQITFADTSTIAYTYDAGDRVTQIADSTNGTIMRTYDGLDRLTQETTAEGAVAYTYDAAGRRATMTVAGQTAVSYTYDNANRLTTITQGTATVTLMYDNAGRRITLTYPNGIVTSYGYANGNQLISLTYMSGTTTLGDLTYTYDAAGHRTSVGGSWSRTGIPAVVTNATYNAGNQLTAWGATTLSYDLNGNVTSDGTKTYSWNARDELTGLVGAPTASFQYDGVGRRRGKTVGSTITRFLYDGSNLAQELSGSTPIANLLTTLGIDETLTRTETGATMTILADAQGSTVALTNTAGAVQTTYSYEPFGATQVSGSSSTNTTHFTGRVNDGTGLYYYRARYYSPSQARFIAEDPLEFDSGSTDLYQYVRNDPTDLTDPFGLRPLTACEKDRLRPYFPQRDLDNADIHDGEVPWWLSGDFDALTIGDNIYFRPHAYDPSTNPGLALLAHELEHVGQYRMGMSVPGYLLAGQVGYLRNPYERAARDREQDVRRDLDKKKYPPCKKP